MDEPLGYHIFNSSTRQWLNCHDQWVDSYHDACDFCDLEGANRTATRIGERDDEALYVFACMPSA